MRARWELVDATDKILFSLLEKNWSRKHSETLDI